jgi:hypothetical protein
MRVRHTREQETMNIIKNEKLIKRNAKIGQYSSIFGLLIVVGTVFYSVQFMRTPETATQTNTFILWGVLLLGIVISQVSMYFGTRWGRRPDEAMDKALKGLPGDFTLYHYSSPVPHLLVGPAGVWILLPYHLRGVVTYTKNRWRIGGGGFTQSYMRIFGQESIGRPDLEVGGQAAALEKHFKKKFEPSQEIPPVYAALVFLDERIEINAEDSPLPAMQIKKLKDFIRKAAKEKPFPPTELAHVKTALPDG